MKTLKGSNQVITTCHKSLQNCKTYKNILEFTDWNLFSNEEEFLFKMLPSNLELKQFKLFKTIPIKLFKLSKTIPIRTN